MKIRTLPAGNNSSSLSKVSFRQMLLASPKAAISAVPCKLTRINNSDANPFRQQGFTLLELMMVLSIMVLGFSAISISLSSGNDTLELKSAARDMVSALRYARGQALVSHQQTTIEIDLSENSYTVSGRDKSYQIPEDIDISVVTGQDEVVGDGVARIRFFPDGSSIGGRISLEKGNVGWQIDVNWLTGASELNAT
ncbi:MAG: GspH/FimT family pseudopilin [Methylococcales bacterium]|nr:GspH/FimT family pseudopilin [Methylococcales bacterium]